MSGAKAIDATGPGDIETLAKGGRTNFLGFLLRLAARLPFLFIAGRWYGADALGRFAYATIIVEFAGQLATMGLKRGLAQQLANTKRDPSSVVWDGLLVGMIASVIAAGVLMAMPQLMFPNSEINHRDYLLPLTIFGWAGSDIALAALAYRGDIGATLKARSLIEPWVISIAAFGLAWYSLRDGLIMAYAISAAAAFAASLYPLLRTYGRPRGWRPEPIQLSRTALKNLPLAGADAIEWGSRRLDIAMLGLFFAPAIVGIYYVAQQVASLPQKLKTSFDPILGPVITQNLAEDNKKAVAKQVRQVGFWIIAAQIGIALALSIPGKAVMGLVGPSFVGGTGALAVLLAAEAIAATAVVSEAALIYVAPWRNLAISVAMIVLQAALSVAFVYLLRALLPALADAGWVKPRPDPREDAIAAAGPAIALMVGLGLAAIAKALLLRRMLGARVNGWRWSLIWAALIAGTLGWGVTRLPHSFEWFELVVGVPLILGTFGAIIWFKGFNQDDRALFRSHEAAAT
ncbi:lipopolysaccharide biosynthesis protein [Sphingomonas crusticola]|uniref:lipopolysaccharide biosynthesis protein n=1 Tax=Sphingomonas crusticola TaxID=1697973 RepID=UPI000E248D88|nr:lipopolysaccharide biosynthesis protein [Sphingomonas crusticola]